MPFYKRENEELLTAPNYVIGPGFELRAETHTEHTYPVNGWYWFNDLDAALLGLVNANTNTQVVTIRQAKLALLDTIMSDGRNMLDAINDIVQQADRATQIEWEYATEIRRDSKTLITLTASLGMSDVQLDELFSKAASYQ